MKHYYFVAYALNRSTSTSCSHGLINSATHHNTFIETSEPILSDEDIKNLEAALEKQRSVSPSMSIYITNFILIRTEV